MIIEILRDNPVIPLFLTLGCGFWLGSLRYKAFSLGVVPATLLAGVIIGQLDIVIPPIVKSLFFILFLFSIGYSVGPQFFHAFKGNGFRQVLFAAVEALICVGTVVAFSKLMGYGTGESLGLFAGSQTASASLGLITDTVAGLDIAAPEKEHIQKMVPACYAVTYVFGAIGSAWFLSLAGPRLLGGLDKVKAEAKALEHTALPKPEPEKKSSSDTTDMIFIGFGVALGCFIGAISFNLKTIPISLSTTGGALLMGIVLGWWRNRHPRFGYIPPQVVWFLDNIGLNLFIAIIGLTAGPSFIPAIREVGVMLVAIGAVATILPLAICIFIGRKIFRFSTPETLGCVAGARCGVAAIGAIQDTLDSTVPMVGYTVCYASANFILVFSSLIVLFTI